jgi:hypothetical protein
VEVIKSSKFNMKGSKNLKRHEFSYSVQNEYVFLQRFSICSALYKAQAASSAVFARNVTAAIVNVTI